MAGNHFALHCGTCMYCSKLTELWFLDFSKEIITNLYKNRIPHEPAFACKVESISENMTL